MNKYFKSLLFLLFTAFISIYSPVYASEYMPMSIKAINNHSVGVYFAPVEIKIYASPDEKSELKEIIRWNLNGVDAMPDGLSSSEAFVAFIPGKKYALMPVMEEDDTENWVEVIYNKKTGEKGWVKKQNPDNFKTWLEFMQTYGKQNRLYQFSDIPENYKSLHTGPDENCQTVNDSTFIAVQEIEITYISGNWMLVREVDYSKSFQIGWMRWRDNDGNMFVFPRLGTD